MFNSHSAAPLFLLRIAVLSTCLHAPQANAAPASISNTITVNFNGSANYKTIQDAINSVPDNNNQWIKIHVAAGIYREKVMINITKPYIFLEGEGADKTSIEWGDYTNDSAGHDTMTCATFTSNADNFVASGIAFKNTYGQLGQAVAALITGDKAAFYGCSFVGVQDTLFDYLGRHYYAGCDIEGSIDFIFGTATSHYEGCRISTVEGRVGIPGVITANGRDNPNDTSGFVFKNCSIAGKKLTQLGRAWRPYSRVIYYETEMSNMIVPQGWGEWNAKGRENDTTFAEFQCTGPGSDISKRVPWEKKLSDDEVKPFIDTFFIDKEGWINAQPSTS